jgi:hypothetical protein
MNVMAFYFVLRDKTNNATGLDQPRAKLGGSSIGISLVTTLLDRRAQFHQNRLVEHLQRGILFASQRCFTRFTRLMLHGLGAVQATMQA